MNLIKNYVLVIPNDNGKNKIPSYYKALLPYEETLDSLEYISQNEENIPIVPVLTYENKLDTPNDIEMMV